MTAAVLADLVAGEFRPTNATRHAAQPKFFQPGPIGGGAQVACQFQII